MPTSLLLCLDTGTWRTKRPVVDKEKMHLLRALRNLLPAAMYDHQERFLEPNLSFCKGCGICAKECPRAAIVMLPEGDFTS